MKLFSSWGIWNYLLLIAALSYLLAIAVIFLRRRKGLHRQGLLRWLFYSGAIASLLTAFISRNTWLSALGFVAYILLWRVTLFLPGSGEEEQRQRPRIEPPLGPGIEPPMPTAYRRESKPQRHSWFLPSLDDKDKKLLLWFLGVGLSLAVAAGVLIPKENDDANPMPSTYLSGQHGARAAYETLLRSGYPVERWERPLAELAPKAGPDTVLIVAQPFPLEDEDIKAVRTILERGGRVLSTGFWGGSILPGKVRHNAKGSGLADCQLEPEGLDPLSDTGEVWMKPEATWTEGDPAHRVEYSCSGKPAVVEFDWGKGHAVWWANSTPLENGSLARAHDLDLLLNSLGAREGHRFYWDESLHGVIRSNWSFAAGPALTMLRYGLPALALLVIFGFSRRSGPVRDLPLPARAAPIEFIDALGSLYRKAGAASTVVAIAWERFRRHSLRFAAAGGVGASQMGASELAAAIRRRFPQAGASLETDLAACEDAARGETVDPREALKLVQALHERQEEILAAQSFGGQSLKSENIHSNEQERAS
jgi:hypothetical protein